MGFGSILSGIYHAITPSRDGGSVFSRSSYQPQKKKLQPGDPGYVAPVTRVQTPNRIQQPGIQNLPTVQRPDNLLAGLNANLSPLGQPKNTLQVKQNADLKPLINPQPGTVINPTNQPAIPVAPKPPDHSIWGRIKSGAKTVGQTAAGTVANIPEVGLAAVRAGTGLVQGATQLPHVVSALTAFDTEQLNKALPNRFTHALNTGAQKVNTGVNAATKVVDKPFNFVNRGLDTAAKAYAARVPAAANGAKVYTREQIPLNILAGLLTLGGSTAGEAGQAGKLGEASDAGRFTRFLNKPLIANENNIIARTSQTIGNRATPVVQALSSPFKSTREAMARFNNTRNLSNIERQLVDSGEAGNILGNVDNATQVPVGTGIDVNAPASEPVTIPVRNTTPQGIPIRELSGDTPGAVRVPTVDEAAAESTARRFRDQGFPRPSGQIEGVKPTNTGNTGLFTKAEIATEKQALDDALANKEITKTAHKAASKELDALTAVDEAPKGQKITVNTVDSIPVQNQTEVPQNLPETPGTVRVTASTAPANAEAVAAATAPTVAPPTQLPAEVQTILDNPKQFNKRQVAAARNQAKLANKYAKTQEDIAAATDRAGAASPIPSTSAGFAPTGEFRQGENGNVSQVAHGSTEAAQGAADTATLSSGDVIAKAGQDIAQNGLVSPESARNLQAMLDSGRFAQTSPEYKAMAKTLYGAGSDYGRGLSLFNPTMRRTASGEQLTNRFVSKLYGVTEDTSKLTDAHIAAVSDADSKFTAARDAANQALDRYNTTKSAEDFTAWKQATQVADEAEKQALVTEYRVANEVLKGNRSPEALKAVQQAEKNAGVYQMDWVDANMLSGTGTAARNFANTGLVRTENRLFGGRGYSSKGAKIGNAVGNRSVVADFKARGNLDQNALSKTIKQWSTTTNTFGEGNIKAVGSARAYKFYENVLKDQGVVGDQLKRDTEVMLHTDPENMGQHYEQWALSENALSGMSHSKKIEQTLVDAIASKGGGKLSQTAAKALVRLTVGFPTVIGRSLIGGAKRAGLGLPDLVEAGVRFAKGDTQAMKDALYAAKVHAGSGAALYALGTGLAQAGLISPSYPSDPAEQARWKAEGIQPNSIKIGGNWFGIPGYFGALALPLVIPANVMNKTTPGDITKGIISGIQDLSPTTGIVNFVNGMEGRGGKQWVKNEVTSLTRAFTPVGSLLNQIAKMTDDTKNDTTTKDAIGNLLDSIASGIPGVNNKVNTIPATDNNGNVLHNPNPIATVFGSQGSDQPQGIQDVKQAQGAANDSYKQLSDYGILQDKTLMGLVDKKIQAQIARGQNLSPEQVASVQKAVVKGVSNTGEDTAYLEKGQYDTNSAVLKLKKDLISSDPTTKPSDLTSLDTAIKRSGVYKDNKIPYDQIKEYKSVSLDEWRKLGDPEASEYDPEAYQRLWNMDQLMVKNGVSYGKKLDKEKYSAKPPGKGKAVKQLDTSFGTLKPGSFAPTVQQYDTISTKSGSVPHISVVRPNIVHKISGSG